MPSARAVAADPFSPAVVEDDGVQASSGTVSQGEDGAVGTAELAEPESVSEVAPKTASKRRPRSPNGVRRPRRSRAKSGEAKPPTSRRPATPRSKPLEHRITDALSGIGAAVMVGGAMRGDPALFSDGLVVADAAPPVGVALGAVCRENPEVGRIVENLLSGSAYTALAFAVGGVALGIARNHALIAVPPAAAAMLQVPPMATQADLDAFLDAQRQAATQTNDV